MAREPIAQSALHHFYAAHGAHMEVRGAWQAAARFTSVAAELDAARTALVLGERTGIGVLDIVGTGLAELALRLGVQDAPTAAGLHGSRWYRLTRNQARIIVLLAEIEAARTTLENAAGDNACVHVTNVSSGLTTLVLAGPSSPDLLARLVRVDLEPHVFENKRLCLTGAVGIPLQVVRWDRGDLHAYELTVGRDVAEYFCDSLLHAGDDLGMRLMGADALAQLES
ncbi:MAG TPA: sarcosine oxidase subunit gamma family protein [Abditibacteriaceae bacterium]|nr:sarcosine oxidase subunit gamma family protein [Abditibacteriaceae bacterium]